MILNNRDWTVALSLMTVSLVVKIVLTAGSPVINPDGALYLISARFISEGDFERALLFYRYPLFPFLISTMHAITENWLMAARILVVVPSALCVLILYGIIREVAGSRAAIYGSLAFLLAPIFNETSTWIIRDHLALFFALTGIFLTLRGINAAKIGYYLLALIFFIFAAIVRIEYLVLLAPWFFAGIWERIFTKRDRLCLVAGVVALSTVVIAVSSYSEKWVTYLRVGELIEWLKSFFNGEFFENYRSVYRMLIVLGEQLPNSVWHPNFSDIARHYIPLIYFVGFLETCIKAVHLPFFLMALVGLKDFRNYKHRLCLFLFLVASFLPGYASLLFRNFLAYRYVFLMATLLFIPAGVGFHKLQIWIRQKNNNPSPKKKIFTVAIVVVLVLVSVEAFVHAHRRVKKSASAVVDASSWLKTRNITSSCYVASDDPRVGWYWSKGDRFILLPPGFVPDDPAICYFVTDRPVDEEALKKCNFCPLISFGKRTGNVTVYGRQCDRK